MHKKGCMNSPQKKKEKEKEVFTYLKPSMEKMFYTENFHSNNPVM